MTTEPAPEPTPAPRNPIARAYKKWLRDTPEGQQERRAMEQRIMALQEQWDRKGL